jgi:hypothetical protein
MKKQITIILFNFIFVSIYGQNSKQFSINFINKLYFSSPENYRSICYDKGLVAFTEVDFCLPNDYLINKRISPNSYCISDERASNNTIEIQFPVSNYGKKIKYTKNPIFEKFISDLQIKKIPTSKFWSSHFQVYVTKYRLKGQFNIFIFKNMDYMEVVVTNDDFPEDLYLVK